MVEDADVEVDVVEDVEEVVTGGEGTRGGGAGTFGRARQVMSRNVEGSTT
jgi:hypothetical protein